MHGVWRVLLCLLLVLAAELLPGWFVQRGRVALERQRFTAKSAKIIWKYDRPVTGVACLADLGNTFLFRCVVIRVPNVGKMRLSSVGSEQPQVVSVTTGVEWRGWWAHQRFCVRMTGIRCCAMLGSECEFQV